MKIRSYKDLIVWQKSFDLVVGVYLVTKKFPREELFGLTSQIRRAVVSIPSNIAEGFERKTRREFQRFLIIALASASELETQLCLAVKLNFMTQNDLNELQSKLIEIFKLLNFFIKSNK